jgi:transcriptional regulator with PAS, ATPase and Fis domain
MNTSNEIIIFSASNLFSEVSNRIINNRNLNKQIKVIETTGKKIIDIAKSEISKGTKVFIARGRNITFLRNNISVPVINVPYTYEDFHNSVKKANCEYENIGLVGFDEVYDMMIKFKEISGYNVQIISPKTVENIEEQIIRVINPNIKVLIGGFSAQRVAKKNNLKHIMLDVNMNSMTDAINNALNILESQVAKDRYLQTILTTINLTSNAIINFNTNGDVIFSNNLANNLFKEKELFKLKDKLTSLLNKNDASVFDYESDNIYNINDKDYIIKFKPVIVQNKVQSIITTINSVKELQESEKKLRNKLNTRGHIAKNTFNDIISNSKIMKSTIYEAKKYSNSNSSVLITGKTGTGKELFAQSIHNESKRANEPFVAINCAALPNSILESELFGYVKGAFTDANKEGKMGIFELAHGGTVFLDEIGEMDINIQAKILRVLQEKEISRLGDNRIIPINVRVICATNKNLLDLIEQKKFREDLYYRLAVLELKIPTLNERLGDIPYLIDYYIKNNNYQVNFSNDAIQYLCRQDYIGNVRQLFNILERIIVLSNKKHIAFDDFKKYFESANDKLYEYPSLNSSTFLHEKNEILRSLKNNHGSRKKTAEELNVSLSTLWRKMKKYNIEYNE